jgi:predicted N-acyltransferase
MLDSCICKIAIAFKIIHRFCLALKTTYKYTLVPGGFQVNASSLHVTFPSEGEFSKMKDNGLLQRIGLQYHWRNRNYKRYA